MTRYVMVVDLRRCIGCQTCTAACKQANATPPGVQWRRVVDIETGTYPDVLRTFVPVSCMHCGESAVGGGDSVAAHARYTGTWWDRPLRIHSAGWPPRFGAAYL